MANISLGRAVLVLTTELGSWVSDLNQAEQHTRKLQDAVGNVGKGLKSFGKDTTELGKSLTTTITAPILGVIGGLSALAITAASTGDDIAKNAREANLSAQSYQELTYALSNIAKVSDDDVVKGFAALTDAIGQASSGNQQFQKQLQALGFSMTDIRAGSIDTEDAFNRLSAAVQRAESPAQALAFAGDLMGQKIGRKLAGALRESGDEVDTLRQRAHELGGVLGDDALQASEAFNDTIDDLKMTMRGLVGEVGSELMPVFTTQLVPAFREHVIPALKTIASLLADAIRWFATLSPGVQGAAVVFTGLVAAIGPALVVIGSVISAVGTIVEVASAVVPIVTTVGGVIAALGAGPLIAIVAAIGAVVLAWRNWDTIVDIAKRTYEGVRTWLVEKFGGIVNFLDEKINKVVGFFDGMYNAVVGRSSVPDMVDGIGEHFGRLDQEMVAKSQKATKKVKDAFDGLLLVAPKFVTSFEDIFTSLGKTNNGMITFGSQLDSIFAALGRTTNGLMGFNATALETVAAMGAANAKMAEALALAPQVTMSWDAMLLGAGRYKDGLIDVAAEQDSWMTKLNGWISNVPAAMGQLQGTVTTMISGLFGGGGVMQSIVGTGLNAVFGPLGGMVGELVGKGMAAMGDLVWKGLKKIGGFFKDLFGGPSAEELAGREVVANFEENIQKMVSEADKIEAGNENWKLTVIALRDAYIAQGLTQEEALRDAERLWGSSKLSSEEQLRIIEDITRKMQGLNVVIPVRFDVGPVNLPDLPAHPMQHGGFGHVTKPTLFLAGEAGPEDVAFSGAHQRLGGMDASAIAALTAEVSGLRADLLQQLPARLAKSTVVAMVKAGVT